MFIVERQRYVAGPSSKFPAGNDTQRSPGNQRNVGVKMRRGRSKESRTKPIIVLNGENVVREEFGNGERRNCDHGDVKKYVMADILEGNGNEDEISNRRKMCVTM